MTKSGRLDTIVVGGGIGGLATAAYLARAGRSVTVLERASTLGGRAATHIEHGFHFNLGPHALYRGGAAMRVLQELGVAVSGRTPSASGGYAIRRGRLHALPGGFVSLLTTGLLPLPAKLEAARFLATVAKLDGEPLHHTNVRQWLADAVRHADVRALIEALVRLTTYVNAPSTMSAGTALAQVQMALSSNVLYLDGGWQTLVDALRQAAEHGGARMELAARVEAVAGEGAVSGVRLSDGTFRSAEAVVLAVGPREAAAMLTETPARMVREWADAAVPVHAACLDVGLSRLPQPRARFALGIDRPLYFSVHSAAARLAPADAATIHVARYLDPTEAREPKDAERELEGVLDLVQPGWRSLVVTKRFLPAMTVAHACPTAAAGGTAGRPGPAVAAMRNLYVVGDWVGPEGVLADASLASAERAARQIVARPAVQRAAA